MHETASEGIGIEFMFYKLIEETGTHTHIHIQIHIHIHVHTRFDAVACTFM